MWSSSDRRLIMATSSLCNSLLKWVSAGTLLCQRGGQGREEINTSRQRQARIFPSPTFIYLFYFFPHLSAFISYFLHLPIFTWYSPPWGPSWPRWCPHLYSPLTSTEGQFPIHHPPHTNMKRDKISWNSCVCEETRHYGCPGGSAAASPLSPLSGQVSLF